MRVRDLPEVCRRLYPFILIRQLLFPVLCYVILQSVMTDQLLIGSFALLFALPTATMTLIFVENAGQDVDLAAKGTVLSTLASFFCYRL